MQLLSFLALWFAKAFASLTPRKPRRPPEKHIPTHEEEEEAAYEAWCAEVERLFTVLETMLEQWKNGTLPEQIQRARKQANKTAKKTQTVGRMPIRHPSPKYETVPPQAPHAIQPSAPRTPHPRRRISLTLRTKTHAQFIP